MTRAAALAVLFVSSLALFLPSLAWAGSCPVCTSAADCSGNPSFCVLHDSDVGCGAERQICCPGQACGIAANGRPTCENRGSCTVIDESADAGPGADAGTGADAGPGTDGGADTDGGPSGTDAGPNQADAGSSEADAGSSSPDPGADSDSGGCSTGARSLGTGALAAMALLGLILRRRAVARAR